MATLVVFKFPTADGAQTMLYTLEGLQKQQLIQVQDGAIVTWPTGAKKPKITPGTSALFLLESGAVVDRVAEAVKGQPYEIIQTNLSKEQEAKLRADFAE